MIQREAGPADIHAITAIYNATISSRMVTADTSPVTEASRLAWLQRQQQHGRPVWVLDDAGTIAAWLSFDQFHPRPAYAGTAMVAVYVAEPYRRQGLAHQLVSAALQQAPKLGLHTLLGYIFAHNEPSLQLFAKLGFIRWGHLPKVAVLDGLKRDLIIVGRRTD